MGWTERDIPDLHGRTAVVTGANGGLGLETARALAIHGANVVMAVRDTGRGDVAAEHIRGIAPEASLAIVELDLASLSSVRRAAADIALAHPTIDILVANGGVMAIPFARSADGFELQLAVNHLGHFALIGLLLPTLLRSPRGRVVSVTSTGRYLGRPLDPVDLDLQPYDPWAAYGRAKLAAVQLTIELDRRFRAAGVRARAMVADPGFARTDLQANAARQQPGRSQRFFDAAVRRFGSTPAQGALPQLRAATDPRARGGSLYAPRLLVRGSPTRMPLLTRFVGASDRRVLWATSERLTEVRIDVEAALRDGS